MNRTSLRELVRLQRALSETPAYDFEALTRALADGIARVLAAPDASIMLATRHGAPTDPLGGWVLRHTILAHDVAEERRGPIADYTKRGDHLDDPHVKAMVAGAGTTRAKLRFEAVTREQWVGSPSQQLYDALGVCDHLVGALPLAEGLEFFAAVHHTDDAFTTDDRDMLVEVLEATSVYARYIALSFALPGQTSLRPRERQTLALLLRGHSEKVIADRMALRRSTVHQYVVTIYRRLGIRSRAELLALWLDPKPAHMCLRASSLSGAPDCAPREGHAGYGPACG